MKKTILYISLILFSVNGFSQTKIRTLPRNINAPNYNNYYPAISGDGNSLVFMSNFTNSGESSMSYTYKIDVTTWSDPVELPRAINLNHLLFEGGYSLNFNGKTLFFTFKKSGGIGGYDIWYSKFSNGTWQGAKNMGNKINTSAHEGMPSISSSGESLYYCRCETMNEIEATGCKIVVATKNGSLWEDAKPLPNNVNSYNPQSPKIMADGETLIFSSKQGGSADLYLTRKTVDGSWTDPVSMNFANTTNNEQFVSVAAKGRYLFHDVKSGRGRAIEMLLIPDEFKAKDVMHVKGTVVNPITNERIPSTLKVYDIATRERIVFQELNENSEFNFAIKEGKAYDFSIEPKDNSYGYFSKIYDLGQMKASSRDELEIKLSPFKRGQTVELGALAYSDMSTEIDDNATYELRRLVRLLKNNSNEGFELKVHRYNYLEDNIASSEDLTEVIIDTLWTEIEKTIQVVDTIMVPYAMDSTASDSVSSVSNNDELSSDSASMLATNFDMFEQRIEVRDSVIMVPYYDLKYTYHNDRTLKQVKALVQYLVGKGLAEEQLQYTTSKTTDRPPRGKPQIIVSIKML
ncbi:MAG: hypothetical protein OEW67_09585 [Cyclobacteriaceae bacterium]|nr:hypothetical protein [Cyclobacteriaceae bacterium]